mgnify:CR=1 FL=1
MARWWALGAMVLLCAGGLLSAGCRTTPPPRPTAVVAPKPSVALRVFIYVDDEFCQRFGPRDTAARAVVNDWLYACEQQFRLGFPEQRVSLDLAGIGAWSIPAGQRDGRAIWRQAVPTTWPEHVRANCLIALTGRRGVCWSGVARWPRLYAKAQEHEPVSQNTIALLCHEMSHWFGAEDIIDAKLPEASVMNYRDAHDGWREGRLCWDKRNRALMAAKLASWTS